MLFALEVLVDADSCFFFFSTAEISVSASLFVFNGHLFVGIDLWFELVWWCKKLNCYLARKRDNK